MKIRIASIIGILLSVAAIVCFALCIAQNGNSVLLSAGFLCTAAAIVINRIVSHISKKDK